MPQRLLHLFTAALLCAACTAHGDAGSAVDSPAAARVEAQAALDSAAAMVARHDYGAAARELRDAARFCREHPDLRTSSARGALVAVALDLDRVADEVARGKADTTELARVLARVQFAEAEHHRGRAVAAWTRHDTAAAGLEHAYAIDHVERGLCDARLTRTPAVLPTMRQHRELAQALLSRGNLSGLTARLDGLAREIARYDAGTRTGVG